LCAWVGDSRAVLGSVASSGQGSRSTLLSSDHKPGRADEKARVEKVMMMIIIVLAIVDFATFPLLSRCCCELPDHHDGQHSNLMALLAKHPLL
jgi:hypothetical protein